MKREEKEMQNTYAKCHIFELSFFSDPGFLNCFVRQEFQPKKVPVTDQPLAVAEWVSPARL